MKTYFVSDALACRMLDTANANTMLGFEKNIPRGAELEDSALLALLNKEIVQLLCTELTIIDSSAFYIISNFVTLSDNIKNKLTQTKNYIIFEHDHKYVQTRNPFSYSTDGIVPEHDKININFYRSAQKVICITDWHEQQIKLNTEANTTNIHGGIWTYNELDRLALLSETKKNNYYCIFWSRFKNPDEARAYAHSNNLKYRILNSMPDRDMFLNVLSMHKGLIFFPRIPETGSRLIIESKMLGLEVHTNKNSGAANEYWFNLDGKDLINLFKNTLLPNTKKLFEEFL